MATQAVRPPTVQEFMSNGYAWDWAEAATQTYATGALLVHSAGYAQESGADPADKTVLGFANGPGQNGTLGQYNAHFTPVFPGSMIEANLCAGASANTKALAQTDVGVAYGMIKRTVSGEQHWVLDSTETDAGDVIARVVGLRDAVGDINGRVLAVIVSAKCAFGG